MTDRWVCGTCGWTYEGPCRPHEPFGWTVQEVGKHLWEEHRDVASGQESGVWSHHEPRDARAQFHERLERVLAETENVTDRLTGSSDQPLT